MRSLPNKKQISSDSSGFTLVELLVVIGILTVLLSIVLIAINPSRQFQLANNTQRRSDVSAILNAIHHYAAENSGSIPSGITDTAQTIASSGGVDICSDLVSDYVAEMPRDPTTGSWTSCSTYDTQYTVLSTSNRVTVAAPDAELSATISITR